MRSVADRRAMEEKSSPAPVMAARTRGHRPTSQTARMNSVDFARRGSADEFRHRQHTAGSRLERARGGGVPSRGILTTSASSSTGGESLLSSSFAWRIKGWEIQLGVLFLT